MSITDKIVPYEILIRFGEDGIVKGGHYQERRIIEMDGERLKDEVGYAKPLGASPEEVKALLPGVALTAFAEIDRLLGLIASHERQVEALNGQLSEADDAAQLAQAAVARLTPELEAAHLSIEQGGHRLAKLDSDLADAAAHIVDLTSRLEERDSKLAELAAELAEARAAIANLTQPIEEEPV